MEWIDIKTQTPPKDTTVLGYSNGAFVVQAKKELEKHINRPYVSYEIRKV